MKSYKLLFLVLILSSTFGYQNLYAQVDFITPPAVKKVDYANREITFSEVTMNGEKTTYLEVEKGATVKIKTRIESKRVGDYCPGCIVQVYWGIHDYTSVCAKSFGGYRFKKKKSKHEFQAPMKDGIYYITMGGSLQYSCKNSADKPRCESDYAFAVIKVGNPDPEKKITLDGVKNEARDFLKTTVVKRGAFGPLDQIQWFFEGEPLAYEGKTQIPLTKFGTYKAKWFNCLTSVADSVIYSNNGIEKLTPIIVEEEPPVIVAQEPKVPVSEDITDLIENNDSFVLKNLTFDLNKSNIKPEAMTELNKLAKIMRDTPTMRILLEGHTAIGRAKRNQVLSEKRVKSTKAYLVKQGVVKSHIKTKGWGQQKPLVYTRDIEKGKINRRVEIQILSR